MITPLIISIAAALLCSGCTGFLFWGIGEVLAGDTSWAEASYPIILSQLGILFFAIIALVCWKNYKDEPADSKGIAYMCFALFLEVGLLLGIKTGVDIHERIILLKEGTETRALITGYVIGGSGKKRHRKPQYEFRTPGGTKVKGTIGFQMKMRLPLGENSSISLSSHEVTYRIGSTVPVRYMPANPECHVVTTFGELWCFPMVTAVLSCAFLGATGYQIYHYHRRNARGRQRCSRRRRRC